MKKILLFLSVSAVLCSCSKDGGISQESLEAQFLRIQELSKSITCENSADWQFIAVGYKACGGPEGYIAYPTSINVEEFLGLVETYNKDRKLFVEQEGLFSDCLFVSPPAGIHCENGEAVLVYTLCDLEPDGGLCNAAIPKYYYDKETQSCKEFIWGGCNGVVPFDTLEACLNCEGNN
ncbi:Proteinase inhibitor I2, Kunitz metazoa [Croceitalea dokdonensis DOKDO 023]|uniref:Proteinase inhibitor I2, Kunitz metazoa n=1 Tax=Croceitalea dokdonensis DOKDO 023 TaxID=1300341 RepID=A0A0P7AL77_9FLAO|nr:BPTI/Kunitz domain-containing protein [Croceitalea dokdonensis]KPM32627.1 Proteinase inhibitor I2, Kunitz metazoa [Croceitalea dokdonensis DOKDO 023]